MVVCFQQASVMSRMGLEHRGDSFGSSSGWSATGGVVACCATAAGYFKGSRDSTKPVPKWLGKMALRIEVMVVGRRLIL